MQVVFTVVGNFCIWGKGKGRETKERKGKEKKKYPCYSPAEANFFLETKGNLSFALILYIYYFG